MTMPSKKSNSMSTSIRTARYRNPLAQCASIAIVGAAGLWMLAAAGCSDPLKEKRGEVSGTVTLDGQPVTTGEIRFNPSGPKSGPTTGGPITDGKYHIGYKTGPAGGLNQVQFGGTRQTGNRIVLDGKEMDEFVDVFPAKYQR